MKRAQGSMVASAVGFVSLGRVTLEHGVATRMTLSVV
jgi:hypothetical protein